MQSRFTELETDSEVVHVHRYYTNECDTNSIPVRLVNQTYRNHHYTSFIDVNEINSSLIKAQIMVNFA